MQPKLLRRNPEHRVESLYVREAETDLNGAKCLHRIRSMATAMAIPTHASRSEASSSRKTPAKKGMVPAIK